MLKIAKNGYESVKKSTKLILWATNMAFPSGGVTFHYQSTLSLCNYGYDIEMLRHCHTHQSNQHSGIESIMESGNSISQQWTASSPASVFIIQQNKEQMYGVFT